MVKVTWTRSQITHEFTWFNKMSIIVLIILKGTKNDSIIILVILTSLLVFFFLYNFFSGVKF
jgi:hypothetical protein